MEVFLFRGVLQVLPFQCLSRSRAGRCAVPPYGLTIHQYS